MVYLNPLIDVKILQSISYSWMLDLMDVFTAFDFRPNYAKLMFKKRWQVATGNVAVFVDACCQNSTAMLTVPSRVVGAAAKE